MQLSVTRSLVVSLSVRRRSSSLMGRRTAVRRYPVNSARPPVLLRGPAIELATCGAKAANCARLEAMAEAAERAGDDIIFKAPK